MEQHTGLHSNVRDHDQLDSEMIEIDWSILQEICLHMVKSYSYSNVVRMCPGLLKTEQPHLFTHLHIAVREHLAGALVQGEGHVVSMQLTVGPYPSGEISSTAELYVC